MGMQRGGEVASNCDLQLALVDRAAVFGEGVAWSAPGLTTVEKATLRILNAIAEVRWDARKPLSQITSLVMSWFRRCKGTTMTSTVEIG